MIRPCSLLLSSSCLALACGGDDASDTSAGTTGAMETSSSSGTTSPAQTGSTSGPASSSSGADESTTAMAETSSGSSTGEGDSTTGEQGVQPLVFSVMGDVPYGFDEYPILTQQIQDHNAISPSTFMVHVGDIKSSSVICFEATFQDVSGMLAELDVPTFVLPGDNEWNDCTLNIDQSWGWWVEYFSRFNEAWPDTPVVERQDVRDENFAWVSEEVLLMGINLVGGAVHDADEWALRLEQDSQWVESQLAAHPEVYAAVLFGHANPSADHAAFVSRLEAAAIAFDKPMLFIHGDGHAWIDDVPFAAPNLRRVQVEQGGDAPPLQVTVDQEAAEPFALDRMAL